MIIVWIFPITAYVDEGFVIHDNKKAYMIWITISLYLKTFYVLFKICLTGYFIKMSNNLLTFFKAIDEPVWTWTIRIILFIAAIIWNSRDIMSVPFNFRRVYFDN